MRRYEDNGDQSNNLEVVKRATNKKSIQDYGDPRKFLQEVNFIFGDNVWHGVLPCSHFSIRQTGPALWDNVKG